MFLEYTLTNGTTTATGNSLSTNFSSYAQFEERIAANGMFLRSAIGNKAQSNAPVRVYAVVLYSGMPYSGLTIDTYIAPMRNLSRSSFIGLPVKSVTAMVPVPGLQMFNIEAPNYSYTWTPTQSSIKSNSKNAVVVRPLERTTTDMIVLNNWCAYPTEAVRFKVGVAGVTNRYTQVGSPIIPKLLGIKRDVDSVTLTVNMPQGSETIVESSVDLKSWHKVITLHSLLDEETVFFVTKVRKENCFYRICSD